MHAKEGGGFFHGTAVAFDGCVALAGSRVIGYRAVDKQGKTIDFF